LKKENPKFLQHIMDFSEQVSLADQLIQSVIEPKYERWVEATTEGWQVKLSDLKREQKSIQTFFLMTLFQRTIVPKGVKISQSQIQQLLTMLDRSAPQLSLDMQQGWQAVKEYDTLLLKKKQPVNHESLFYLNENEHLFLSEKEWVGLEVTGKTLEVPESTKDWAEFSLLISGQTVLPLTIRRRKNGDKIALTPELTKRLKRIFIDRKIPNSIREQAWVVLSGQEQIIWIPQFVNSYLSIPKETDKILYRLLYKVKQ